MRLANLIDDDGVLVLASAVRLRARFADRGFEDEFPNELLAGAAAEEVCAWQTNEPNDVTIAIQVERPVPPEVTYLGVIRLDEGDELLVLPYSQYTMACGMRRGEPEAIDGLCARWEVASGRYACWVRRAEGRGDSWGPLAFDVFLCSAGPSERPLSEVAILTR